VGQRQGEQDRKEYRSFSSCREKPLRKGHRTEFKAKPEKGGFDEMVQGRRSLLVTFTFSWRLREDMDCGFARSLPARVGTQTRGLVAIAGREGVRGGQLLLSSGWIALAHEQFGQPGANGESGSVFGLRV
jgi:hypothetical protein